MVGQAGRIVRHNPELDAEPRCRALLLCQKPFGLLLDEGDVAGHVLLQRRLVNLPAAAWADDALWPKAVSCRTLDFAPVPW